jgi:hypothetical protein
VEINVSITVLLLHATQSRKIFLYELFDWMIILLQNKSTLDSLGILSSNCY